jgi:UDP-N-acetylenolpyruvoylglucosamine reductase
MNEHVKAIRDELKKYQDKKSKTDWNIAEGRNSGSTFKNGKDCFKKQFSLDP